MDRRSYPADATHCRNGHPFTPENEPPAGAKRKGYRCGACLRATSLRHYYSRYWRSEKRGEILDGRIARLETKLKRLIEIRADRLKYLEPPPLASTAGQGQALKPESSLASRSEYVESTQSIREASFEYLPIAESRITEEKLNGSPGIEQGGWQRNNQKAPLG